MTVHDAVGTIVDGDQLDDGFFNDIILHRKVHTDSTERSHTGDTDWTDTASTFTFGAANDIILSIHIQAQIKNSGAATASMALELADGTNTNYIRMKQIDFVNNWYVATFDSTQIALSTTTTNSYSEIAASVSPNFKMAGTTTATVQLKTSDGGETAYVDEIEIRVVYIKGFIED